MKQMATMVIVLLHKSIMKLYMIKIFINVSLPLKSNINFMVRNIMLKQSFLNIQMLMVDLNMISLQMLKKTIVCQN